MEGADRGKQPLRLARWQSVPNANGRGKNPSAKTKRYLARKVEERRAERREERRQRQQQGAQAWGAEDLDRSGRGDEDGGGAEDGRGGEEGGRRGRTGTE